jgi:hypothetical protein
MIEQPAEKEEVVSQAGATNISELRLSKEDILTFI